MVLPSVGTDVTAPSVVPLQLSPASAAHVPCGNALTVTASFATSTGGEPRAECLEVQLPLCLFATLVPPVKNAGACGCVMERGRGVRTTIALQGRFGAVAGQQGSAAGTVRSRHGAERPRRRLCGVEGGGREESRAGEG